MKGNNMKDFLDMLYVVRLRQANISKPLNAKNPQKRDPFAKLRRSKN